MSVIRLVTRQSQLALVQASQVTEALRENDAQCEVITSKTTTSGDKIKGPLTQAGGKRLFVKELQQAVLAGEADIAVHSVKDMSVHDCNGLCLAAVLPRDDPHDVIISHQPIQAIAELPQQAIIGTSSPRREALLKQQRADLTVRSLRGNIDTRLKKLQEQHYDAIILAKCGLQRLNLFNDSLHYLTLDDSFVPAIGQGAIGIECRTDDLTMQERLKQLNHWPSFYCVTAERAVNQVLGGDCFTPIGAHAMITGQQIHLKAVVGNLTGSQYYISQASGPVTDAQQLGRQVADDLLQQGAANVLNAS